LNPGYERKQQNNPERVECQPIIRNSTLSGRVDWF
jgi:hypothetical protein